MQANSPISPRSRDLHEASPSSSAQFTAWISRGEERKKSKRSLFYKRGMRKETREEISQLSRCTRDQATAIVILKGWEGIPRFEVFEREEVFLGNWRRLGVGAYFEPLLILGRLLQIYFAAIGVLLKFLNLSWRNLKIVGLRHLQLQNWFLFFCLTDIYGNLGFV